MLERITGIHTDEENIVHAISQPAHFHCDVYIQVMLDVCPGV